VNFASRSRMSHRNGPTRSSKPTSRLRACWVTHAAAGCAVTPSTWTRRVPTSSTNSTYSRCRNTVSTVKQVHRQDALGLGAEEPPPGDRRARRCRVDAGPVQDGPYRAGPDPEAQATQLTVDATVAPARVLPGQPHHQRPKLGRHSWATTPVRVAPAASDQILMPAQQRLRLDEQPVPAGAGQQSGESGQDGPVGPVEPRSGHLTPQHRDLMAQHQQFDVLRSRAPRQQRQPPQHLA
jgi:hypothetical protein